MHGLQIHKKTRTHTLVCQESGKTLHRRDNLTVRVRTQSGEKRTTVESVADFFLQSSRLKIQMRYHSGKQMDPCDVCRPHMWKKSLTPAIFVTTVLSLPLAVILI